MRCECCGSRIEVGGHFITFANRPWEARHLVEYKRRRMALHKGER